MVSTTPLKPILILAGPTATGKTALSIELAQHYPNLEIISADSLLVYQELDIGTAKPSLEEQNKILHHLIDICSPSENFTASHFYRKTWECLKEIEKRNHTALIVGGTLFYIKTLLFGLWNAPPTHPQLRNELEVCSNLELFKKLQSKDPQLAFKITPFDRYRLIRALEILILSGQSPTALQEKLPQDPHPLFHLWVIDRSPAELLHRIQIRTENMIQAGLIQEYQTLQKKYPTSRALKAIGYAQVERYLTQTPIRGRKIKPGIEGLKEEITLATRQLVKTQRTWLKNLSLKVKNFKSFILDRDLENLKQDFTSFYYPNHKKNS